MAKNRCSGQISQQYINGRIIRIKSRQVVGDQQGHKSMIGVQRVEEQGGGQNDEEGFVHGSRLLYVYILLYVSPKSTIYASISIWKLRTFIYLIEEYMDKNIQLAHQDTDQTAQQTLTSFRVLSHLLSTNQNFEHLKKKIKVKESNDHHNLNQIKNHQQLLTKLRNVRQRHDEFEKQKQIVKSQQFSSLKTMKVKNTVARTQHDQKIQQLRKEISESKENEYKMICQQRKSIEKNIQRFKENILMQKRKNRDKIVSREKSGKKVYSRYFNDKCEEVYQKNIEDIARMTIRIQEREKEKEKLQKMEMEMAVKQSKSQAQFKQIREQVKSLVGYSKSENSPQGKKERARDSIWVTNKKY